MPPKRATNKDRKATKSTAKSTDVPVGALIPQPHGGAIRNGGTNAGGPGRPPDEIRRRLRELGYGKGLPFLDALMDGDVPVRFVGMCPKCKTNQPLPEGDALDKLVDAVGDAVRSSIDQRLKGLDQAWRYGLGTKDEVTSVSPDVRDRVEQTVRLIADSVPAPIAEPLLAKLSEVWR